MISKYMKLIMLFTMLFFATIVSGKPQVYKQYSSSITLDDYIQANCKKGCVEQEELLKSVAVTASKLDIDFKDLLSIIRVESSFKRKAKSGSNLGVMQVNIKYHRKKFNGRNPFNLFTNVEVGGSIYKDCLIKHKGDKRKALKCFNGSGDPKYAVKFNKAYKEISALVDLDRYLG